MAHKLVILVEEPVEPAVFDDGWPEFLHWAEQMPGLLREVTSRVSHMLFGIYPCSLVHELHFVDQQAAHQALESPAGQAAGRTLQALTGGRMTLFFAQHMEDTLENIQQAQDKTGSAETQNNAQSR
jgi:hypothetical protein